MGQYLLPNNKHVKVFFATPQWSNRAIAFFTEPQDRNRAVIFNLSSQRDPAGGSPAVSLNCRVEANELTAAEFQRHTVRFMQLAWIRNYEVHYGGRKDSDGHVTYRFKSPLSDTTLLDVRPLDNTDDYHHKPYYFNDTASKSGKSYFATLEDSPHISVECDFDNRNTHKFNYLWKHHAHIEFLSYAVFVWRGEGTETRIPLEGWRWSLQRKAVCRWSNADERTPHLESKSQDVIVDPFSTILRPDDELYRHFVDPVGAFPRRIVNLAAQEAINQLRTSNEIWLAERSNYADGLNGSFWSTAARDPQNELIDNVP